MEDRSRSGTTGFQSKTGDGSGVGWKVRGRRKGGVYDSKVEVWVKVGCPLTLTQYALEGTIISLITCKEHFKVSFIHSFYTTCVLVILGNVLDFRTYHVLSQEEYTKADKNQQILIDHEINIIPVSEQFAICYGGGVALCLINWICHCSVITGPGEQHLLPSDLLALVNQDEYSIQQLPDVQCKWSSLPSDFFYDSVTGLDECYFNAQQDCQLLESLLVIPQLKMCSSASQHSSKCTRLG
ncbi:hypothetical protein BYT27DRAFT_7213171 [Phlegmacium glaucopus]|nr:hypothetical protein BYT27DRAFT_7213171 [Phlegmacium glaucopus]